MTKAEWLRVGARINAYWPRDPIPPGALAIWFEDFMIEIDHQAALTAIRRMAVEERRERPPTAGQVVMAIAEAANPDAVWAEVWSELQSAASGYGAVPRYVGIDGETGTPVTVPAVDAIPWSSPEVRELAVYMGWAEFCGSDIEHLKSWEAQTREKWRELRRRAVQAGARKALPEMRDLRLDRRRAEAQRIGGPS